MPLSRRRSLTAALAAAALALGAAALPAAQAPAAEQAATDVAAPAPAEQVEKVDAALLEVMKQAESLGFEGRYALLEPVLSETFDFAYMAQIAVGRHWQELDEGQRQALVEAFSEMSAATFAARFSGYSGERFEIGATRDGPRGSKLVANKLVKGDGEAVPINFLLRETDEGWRIVDILLDAKYSELATKRSEYISVVDNQGFERLLEILDGKIAELRAQG